MRRFLLSIATLLCTIGALAQHVPDLEQLKAYPRAHYQSCIDAVK